MLQFRVYQLLLHMFIVGSATSTSRPIIGVLTVPVESGCITAVSGVSSSGDVKTSCFHSLYSKWIEAAGARVVPLRYDAPLSELDALVGSLNGILFTGGETPIKSEPNSTYMRAARRLLEHTVNASANGERLPLWGTCMGLQTLSILVAEDASVLLSNAFDAESLMLPLDLTPAAKTSRFLAASAVPPAVRASLTTRNVTTNLHHDGVAPAAFVTNHNLASFFDVLSTNVDRKGRAFVSTIEGKTVPVYGAQWHPERPQFEWAIAGAAEDPLNHSPAAIAAMQWVASFFVAEARRNERRFVSAAAEASALIYNYPLVGTTSYQAYLFP